MAWGNGFTINQTLIQQYNLSDPTAFFEDISAVPALVNKTVLSVHVFGPNVTVQSLRSLCSSASMVAPPKSQRLQRVCVVHALKIGC